MTTNTDRVQPEYRPDTDPVEGGASTSSPLWTCPDCDGVGRIAERKDDDGAFQGCPQSTMSIAAREAIAPWVEEQWRTLSALVGCVGMKTLVCRGCGGDGETAQDVPERCSVCGGSGVEVKI